MADQAKRTVKTAPTAWRDVVLICRKCQKKLDGGFGPDGDLTLKKALKRYLKRDHIRVGKGRKAELALIQTGCFDVCPKGAVTVVNAARPDALLVVPAGADLLEVRARLGLSDGRRNRPAPVVIGETSLAPSEDKPSGEEPS